jgi:hypothetical protein
MKTIEEVKEFIQKTFNPEENGGCYWDTGNYDDSYRLGVDHGYHSALRDLGLKLGLELPEFEKVEFY